MINLVTDSTADLGEDLVSRYGIQVIPLSVYMDGKTFQDGVDISPDDLFALVEKVGELPKTAAPSVADFVRVFSRAEESLFIGISSKLSATVQNALLGAQNCDQASVRVVDSLNLSTGIGLLVLRAAELRDQGLSGTEIEHAISSLVPKVRTSFVIDTMKYLYMGGRCTAIQSIAGSLLRIRPVIEARSDGTLGLKSKIHGTRKTALESMVKDFQAHLAEVDLRRVFITHSGCAEDATFLAQELRRVAAPEEILITRAGCVVSSHCGPNTIGILYLVK
jgi:DegV family protein with EDD domain